MLHEQADRQVLAGTSPRLDASGLLGHGPVSCVFWAAPNLTDRERTLLLYGADRLRMALLRYGTPPGLFGMIVGDQLDLEDARSPTGLPAPVQGPLGWRQYDIAILLKPFAGGPSETAALAALVAGYRRVRPMAAEDAALIPMFALIQLMRRFAAQRATRPADGPGQPDIWRLLAQFDPPC